MTSVEQRKPPLPIRESCVCPRCKRLHARFPNGRRGYRYDAQGRLSVPCCRCAPVLEEEPCICPLCTHFHARLPIAAGGYARTPEGRIIVPCRRCAPDPVKPKPKKYHADQRLLFGWSSDDVTQLPETT
jgi:hypothetical protein